MRHAVKGSGTVEESVPRETKRFDWIQSCKIEKKKGYVLVFHVVKYYKYILVCPPTSH